jgi:transcriptional regulator with XRE-family HTH domain
MGLVELGRHTGLSASFLSQLETGRVVPTLRNLARIAMVFSKDLSYFFESEPVAIFRVHRKKDRVRMPQTGVEPPTYTFESLGYMVPDRHMDPYFAEFVPLPAQVEPKAHMHAGFEFLYVLGGELAVRHGDQEATLAQATPSISTRGRPTLIVAQAQSRPKRSLSPCTRRRLASSRSSGLEPPPRCAPLCPRRRSSPPRPRPCRTASRKLVAAQFAHTDCFPPKRKVMVPIPFVDHF